MKTWKDLTPQEANEVKEWFEGRAFRHVIQPLLEAEEASYTRMLIAGSDTASVVSPSGETMDCLRGRLKQLVSFVLMHDKAIDIIEQHSKGEGQKDVDSQENVL